MKSFPERRYRSAGEYLDGYAAQVEAALASVSRESLDQAAGVLIDAIARDATIFACGNGGSAALAEHLICDHQKGINRDTHYRPRVVSLASNVALLTAVSNDLEYAQAFSFPLSLHGRQGDVLITISASGNSENIVRALRVAEQLGMTRIALTGFNGGRSQRLAECNIHVAAHNYGLVEDVHQSCMHALAQYLRQAAMSEELLPSAVF